MDFSFPQKRRNSPQPSTTVAWAVSRELTGPKVLTVSSACGVSQPFSGPLDADMDRFQNGLMAMQIIKPVRTLGYIFQGATRAGGHLDIEGVNQRPEMSPGEWARLRRFDHTLITQLRKLMPKVLARMESGSPEEKNTVFLLQLSLEHFHPLIKGLFSVMGLEAALDGRGRNDFRKRLCECLGESTHVFPDWRCPSYQRPAYTVGGIAVDLYMLRNMIAHGINLREAAQDKKTPVDLLKKVQVVQNSPSRAYCLLLSEAAMYLLCAVISKKVLA